MNRNISQKYRKKALFWARILVRCPGVLTILLSGSLAQNHATENSDIDFFIITRPGQIFMARCFVSLILKLFRQLSREKKHAGKICPNHYITADCLEIREQDAYAANLFAHCDFLSGEMDIWIDFVKQNKNWISAFGKKFVYPPAKTDVSTKIKNLTVSQKRWKPIEKICKKIQQKKLAKHTLPKNAKVWLTDKEIRLHPHPKNQKFHKIV